MKREKASRGKNERGETGWAGFANGGRVGDLTETRAKRIGLGVGPPTNTKTKTPHPPQPKKKNNNQHTPPHTNNTTPTTNKKQHTPHQNQTNKKKQHPGRAEARGRATVVGEIRQPVNQFVSRGMGQATLGKTMRIKIRVYP